jgi:hypothetical protein
VSLRFASLLPLLRPTAPRPRPAVPRFRSAASRFASLTPASPLIPASARFASPGLCRTSLRLVRPPPALRSAASGAPPRPSPHPSAAPATAAPMLRLGRTPPCRPVWPCRPTPPACLAAFRLPALLSSPPLRSALCRVTPSRPRFAPRYSALPRWRSALLPRRTRPSRTHASPRQTPGRLALPPRAPPPCMGPCRGSLRPCSGAAVRFALLRALPSPCLPCSAPLYSASRVPPLRRASPRFAMRSVLPHPALPLRSAC